jgi:hypothetical protein
MMPPWLMRSLRPCRAAHPAVGEAKLRPGRLGAAAASTCHLCASTTDTRPGKGKPIEAQRLPMNPRRRRGIGKREHLPPRSSDRSRQTCCGALGRHTVVLVAIGIAPSRSRAPELTSDSDQRVGAWPGQIARLSSTHGPLLARDPERLRSRPHGSGSLGPMRVFADRTCPRDDGGKQRFGFGRRNEYDWR